jgi:hypothetical protein
MSHRLNFASCIRLCSQTGVFVYNIGKKLKGGRRRSFRSPHGEEAPSVDIYGGTVVFHFETKSALISLDMDIAIHSSPQWKLDSCMCG